MTCPCGICEHRFVGCHAECEAFRAWHNERIARQREKYRQRNRDDMLNGFKAESIARGRRKK